MPSSTTTISNLMSIFYSKEFLARVMLDTRYDWLATKKTMPLNSGKTVYFNRFSRLPVQTTPLTECVNPTGLDMTTTIVSATIAEYGNYVKVCALFELTSIDEDLREHVSVIAQSAAETLDTLIAAEMSANSTVQYANSKTAVSAVATSDTLDGQDIRRAYRNLKKNGARVFSDGYFHGIVPVSAEFDLRADTEWLDAYRYTDAENIRDGEIGRLHGVKFMDTNNEVVALAAGVSSADVYSTFIAGKDALGILSLAGQPGSRIIVKTPGDQDTSNPLNMFSTVGWHAYFVAKVLNSAWIIQIRSGTLA